jgi:hypothetical protein
MIRSMPPELRFHFDLALRDSAEALRRDDVERAWQLLERAHVLGQSWIGPHLRAHWAMLKLGWQRRDSREVSGQVARLFAVIPGTWLGRLPEGNTGGANVSAFQPMPIAEDIKALLDSAMRGSRGT